MNKATEKGLAARQNIVTVATRLFADGGYDATSIETILSACAISRGALYHHFSSKEVLFEAVLETIEAELAEATVRATLGVTDPAAALRTGCNAFLAATRTQRVRQIVLVDAPAVVGWHKWREIDARYGFGLLKAALGAAAEHGRGRPDLVDVFAHMLLASMMEIALLTARADDPAAALQAGQTALGELIDRILAPQ